ncbi:hypothetical protein LY78DRAFT_683791 [Colletotrichum sublineola]|uniref:Uncharacterized protein n=1 Tax=Colletotrichum sublineola TaxID=1173701 RepID=A0A066X9V6_COLSU|nr:hypothetical protein LY78DRAFT_683791 [Colletotrichum sublineola]KDN64464.1 hypothetical protein CSUB01_00421 [Colletotrichum sublineola]
MLPSDRPDQNNHPDVDQNWVARTAGGSSQPHIFIMHGSKMPCGDYVKSGDNNDGQDRAKVHLDNCPRCPRDPKNPSGDDANRSPPITPEPRAPVGSGAACPQPVISIKEVHGTVIHSFIGYQTTIHKV